MFVPGHRQNMIDKALGLRVDVVMFDLEDSVPYDARDLAREQVRAALKKQSGAKLFVRTHAAGHDDLKADLQAVGVLGLEGLVLPKVEGAADVEVVSRLLTEIAPIENQGSGRVEILATIENAIGLIRAPEIAAAPDVIGLMFGAEDFAQNLGMLSVGATGEMLYARSALVVAAASAGKMAVDKVFLDVGDHEGLEKETRKARELGFTGKALIHPGQIETVHRVFRPTEAEMAYARKVMVAFEQADAGGAVAVDGRMVDPPVLAHARRILEEGET